MHPEVSMHTHPLGAYMAHIRSSNSEAVGELMLSSVRKLADMGAGLAICPDNTIHQAFPHVTPQSPIPWLHIAEAVGADARNHGLTTLGVLGTKYLMTGPVYPEAFEPSAFPVRSPMKRTGTASTQSSSESWSMVS